MRLLAAVLTGTSLALTVPPFDFWPLAFLALWPLLIAVRRRTPLTRLALGTVAGLVWSESIMLPWLYPAAQSHLANDTIAAFGLAAGAAWLYGGMYVAAFALVYPWLPRPRWLAAVAAWVVMEWVRARAFAGAPWALLGHGLHACQPLAQLAEWTGVSGLSALALLPAAALADSGVARRAGLVVSGAALLAATLVGMSRLASLAPTEGSTIVAAVGNHHADPHPLAGYAAASASAPDADLTVWPETAITEYLQESPSAARQLQAVARSRGWLLIGGPRHRAPSRYFNSAFLLAPDGRLSGTYDKIRLVPFAERSPWPFPAIVARPFAPGADPAHPLTGGDLTIGPLVCWEAVFPELARQHVLLGADVLVNLSSDRDLGIGAEQAIAFSRFRAIETRRWLMRVSGLGPTVLIDPLGRRMTRDTLGLDATADRPPTFYVRHGEMVPMVAAVYLVLFVLAAGVRTIRRS